MPRRYPNAYQDAPDGSATWRATWQVGNRGATYVTHPLGPALEFFGPAVRVATVNCVGSSVHTDPEHPHDDTCIVLCHLNVGGLIRLRLDMMSNRPQNRYMSLQGTQGCYEGPRDAGGDYRVWLEQRGHASSISRVLSRYQQSLQILGILGRLSCR